MVRKKTIIMTEEIIAALNVLAEDAEQTESEVWREASEMLVKEWHGITDVTKLRGMLK